MVGVSVFPCIPQFLNNCMLFSDVASIKLRTSWTCWYIFVLFGTPFSAIITFSRIHFSFSWFQQYYPLICAYMTIFPVFGLNFSSFRLSHRVFRLPFSAVHPTNPFLLFLFFTWPMVGLLYYTYPRRLLYLQCSISYFQVFFPVFPLATVLSLLCFGV